MGTAARAPVDVFVSYKQGEDSLLAREIVSRLRDAGFTVFIDEDIRSGEILAAVIDDVIATARAVLVLWSRSVRESPQYVLGEAMTAKENGTLVPVALDDSPVTTFFRAMKVSRIAQGGVLDGKAFAALRRDLGSRCGHAPAANLPEAFLPRPGGRRREVPVPVGPSPADTANQTSRIAIFSPRTGVTDVARAVVTDLTLEARRMAVRRTLAAVVRPGAWPAGSAPSNVVAFARQGATPTNRMVGLVDLSLPGVSRTVLVLGDDDLELVGDGSTRASYAELVHEQVRLVHSGYGYTAVVSAGGKELRVRGREQTALLLEVLHLLREELGWIG